ncbi:MAG: ABC transporter ATP-binding protein [Rhizomicrobium sp.]
MTLIALDGVGKRFANGVQALSDLSFAVREGEFVSLLGPSGSGKSTVLRLIAGLIEPDDGTICWQPSRPELGFVFQEPTLMPWTDALANARLPLDLGGVPRRQANAQAGEALARLGLGDFLHAYPRELSGGMKMRVSIARALVKVPRVLLMDEPFAALDEPTRQDLNDDLLKLSGADGITVIFVTHSVTEAAYLSGRVLVLSPRPGRVKSEISLGHKVRDRLSPSFAENHAKVAKGLLATE